MAHIHALLIALAFALLPGLAAAEGAQTLEQKYQQAQALRTGKTGIAELAASEALHKGLVELGYFKSLVRLADIYQKTNRPELALAMYQDAVEGESTYAQIRQARGCAEGNSGALSNPVKGRADLKTLADSSDSTFVKYTYARAGEMGQGAPTAILGAKSIYQDLAAKGHALSLARLDALALGS